MFLVIVDLFKAVNAWVRSNFGNVLMLYLESSLNINKMLQLIPNEFNVTISLLCALSARKLAEPGLKNKEQ